jgi:hypothetical protein
LAIGILFLLICYVLPIAALIVFITRRRLNLQSVLGSWFFRSRLRFGRVAGALVVALYFLQVWSNLRMEMSVVGAYDAFSVIWGKPFPDTIIRLVLVGLLVSLMRTRRQLKLEWIDLCTKTQTRFDLNAAIENWRSELVAQPNLAPDDLRELETHLRDDIAGFQQRGLNDEESFLLARQRVGQPQQLGEEFLKVDPAKVWRRRVAGMVAAILIFSCLEAFSRSLSKIVTAVFFAYPRPISFHTSFVLQSLFYILSVVAIMILITRSASKQPWSFESPFFHSRLRLGTVAVLVIVTLSFLESLSNWRWAIMLTHASIDGSVIFMSWFSTLPQTFTHLRFVGLLVWLMPTQNRKTPKRA